MTEISETSGSGGVSPDYIFLEIDETQGSSRVTSTTDSYAATNALLNAILESGGNKAPPIDSPNSVGSISSFSLAPGAEVQLMNILRDLLLNSLLEMSLADVRLDGAGLASQGTTACLNADLTIKKSLEDAAKHYIDAAMSAANACIEAGSAYRSANVKTQSQKAKGDSDATISKPDQNKPKQTQEVDDKGDQKTTSNGKVGDEGDQVEVAKVNESTSENVSSDSAEIKNTTAKNESTSNESAEITKKGQGENTSSNTDNQVTNNDDKTKAQNNQSTDESKKLGGSQQSDNQDQLAQQKALKEQQDIRFQAEMANSIVKAIGSGLQGMYTEQAGETQAQKEALQAITSLSQTLQQDGTKGKESTASMIKELLELVDKISKDKSSAIRDAHHTG